MPSKIYGAPETAIVFAASGGDVVFTPTSLGAGAGRVSAQWDRGAGSKPVAYRWQARFRAASTPTIGNVVRVYLVLGQDGTYVTGAFSTSDQAVTTENALLNAHLIGHIVIDEASTSKDFVATGVMEIRSRYVQVGFWNALAVGLSSTAGHMEFRLTPWPDELQ